MKSAQIDSIDAQGGIVKISRRSTLPILAAALVPVVLLIGATGASAASQTPTATSQSATSTAEVTTGTVVTRPDGVQVTTPKDWSKMSVSDLAATAKADSWGPVVATAAGGVERTLTSASGETIGTVGWRPATLMQPMDAHGCDDWGGTQVCISLFGTGLHVSEWDTTAYGNWGCATAFFLIGGNEVHRSPIICPDTPSDGVYYSLWAANSNFQDGVQACNQWAGSLARPCEWIEK
jgi:hypothetical protein